MDLEGREEGTKVATLIKRYGEFWSPELVNWDSGRELLGNADRKEKTPDINVWDERGVYVLYKDYSPVYVGKAFRQSIGRRLQLHRASRRKGPRWDSFSWFGLRGLARNGKWRELKRVSVAPDELIETLEALLIVVIDPRLNSRRESLQGSQLLLQSETYAPVDLDQRLASIEESLKLLKH